MYGMDSSSMSLLGFGAIVVVGAVVMYLISLLSMKETSFEDVLEEQRRKKEKEDKERSLHNKQKREQFKKKFDQKKKKTTVGNGKVEKTEIGILSGDDQTKQAASAAPAPTVETKKPAKAKPAKKPEPVVQASVQQKQDSPKPSHPILKPNVSEKQKEEPKPGKTAAEVKAEIQKADADRTRTVSFSDDVQEKQKNDVEQEKPKKKKKKEPEAENEIVGQLKETSLSDRDVQVVLTLVKQKYGIDVGGGAKIRDLQQQLEKSQRLVTQQETNLKNYVSRCMGAEGKIEQLKQDILVEKTKVSSLEKAVEDAESKRKSEVSALKSQHAAEMKQIQEKIAIAKDYEELCKSVANLKTENGLLRSEVEKNATVMSEKQRLVIDLKLSKSQLQDAQKKCSELEVQLQGASKTSESIQQQQGEKEKHLLHKLQEQANSLQQMEQNRNTLDSELQRVKCMLEATQSDSAKLLEQVTSLNDDIESKISAQRALEQRLEESKKVVADRDSKIKNLNKQTSDLNAQVKNFEKEIAQLKTQAVKIEQETKSKSAADAKAADDAKLKELQSSLESVKKEKSTMKDEVDRLKKKNNDLRERSWNVMDNLSRLQKELPEKVSSAKEEGETRCANLESFIKQSLSNAFPTICIKEMNFEAWVAEFMKQASESSQTVQSTQDSSSELEEARNEVQKMGDKYAKSIEETSALKSKLKNLEASLEDIRKQNEKFKESASRQDTELSNAISECEKYKNVLQATEDVLRKLQSSVEVEEGVWKKKVNEAKSETSEAKQNTDNLRKIIKELEAEKSSLQRDLEESAELKKRLEEMTGEVSDLKEQLETAKATVADSLQETEEESGLSNQDESIYQDHQCESTENSSSSVKSESPVQVQYSDTCTETVVVIEQHPDADGFLVIEQHNMEELNKSQLTNGIEDEYAKLKERLEKEKTLSKNLGQAATKLQTALKQSQQQLKEEKEKSAGLEEKLSNGDGDQN